MCQLRSNRITKNELGVTLQNMQKSDSHKNCQQTQENIEKIMMVSSKYRKSRHYLTIAISIIFASTATRPIKAQPKIPLLSQSSIMTTLNSSKFQTSRQEFNGQLAIFLGHEGGIQDAVLSPDGNQVLTASRDKTARLWDNQGNLLVVFRGHENWVYSAKFSPNGQQVLTTSADKTARLWDRQGNFLTI